MTKRTETKVKKEGRVFCREGEKNTESLATKEVADKVVKQPQGKNKLGAVTRTVVAECKQQ